jgi:hypothetical protein
MKDLDRAVAQAMGLKSVNNCEKWGKEMNEEDEAFEQLALKQGQWEHTSGWRKKQIAHMDVHSHPAEFVHLHRNDTLEEVAVELETKFTLPFGRDTVQSFVAYIRGMKR